MAEKLTNEEMSGQLTKQEKVVSLFKFIGELNKLKQKVILRVSEYPWWKPIAAFPEDPDNIKIYYRDRVENEESDEINNVLLSVHRPEFQQCPEPESEFEEWLEAGWDNYRNEVKVKEFFLYPLDQMNFSEQELEEHSQRIDEENKTYKELFSDSAERVSAYTTWMGKRDIWAEKQKVLARTRNFFSELYKICVDLDRDAETLELVVADGFIRDRLNPQIDHPLLTRRVKIRHDSVENTIYIEDSDVETELYTVMFQSMENVNLASINHLRDDLHQNDYHPLDRNDLPVFLKMFIHQLSSESVYSETGVPENWQKKERLLLYRNPCYILRKRMDGALKAIEQIVEHVNETGEVPDPIGDIVSGGKIDIPEDTEEPSIEEQLAAVGGESVDILLSKEANKEQLEIARRIERYNAVLVQGPPGTGKTHTIANLMGHFLAQGKSVLVTSHTQKALSVLKEKVAPGLQSLCVSVLDDSNVDMEKSIDGITSYMAQTTSFEVKKEMESLGQERKEIINELAAVRKKLFATINQECNCIVYNGESVSPSAAAAYVQKNSEHLSYIPGKVHLHEPLPLTFAELTELYQSNGIISLQDESEFEHDIPNPTDIMSPETFEQMTTFLYEYEQEYNKAHSMEIRENHLQRESMERQISGLQKKLERKESREMELELRQLQEQLEETPELKPVRFFADDCSSEALTSLMAANNGVFSVISTEGGIFDIMAGRYSNKSNIDVWLKGHCGDAIYVDRMTREAECIMHPALSAILSIQPSVLDEIMSNTTMTGRGLIARFLYASPPSRIGSRVFRTQPIPPEVTAAYRSLIFRLMALPIGGDAQTVHLSEKAFDLMADYFQEHEKFLVGEGQAISDWASKYIGAVLRIAGLLHCADMEDDKAEVTASTMSKAIQIGKYFLAHSTYAYSMMGTDLTIQKAKFVLAKLKKKNVSVIKRSELFQMCRGKFFKKTEEIFPTLELLEGHGYIRLEEPERQSVGRPADVKIIVNPTA